jgi:hypothetical protein
MKLGEFERATTIQEELLKIKSNMNKLRIAKKALEKGKSGSSVKGKVEVFHEKKTQTIEMNEAELHNYVDWRIEDLKRKRGRLEKEFSKI